MTEGQIQPVAFLSYAHLDDEAALQELTAFHEKLQSELRMHIGLPIQIFFDKKSIGWGKRWLGFITHGLEDAAFLVPILTPAFFQSKSCKDEYNKFLDTEKKLGRRDLSLPVYYIKGQEIEHNTDDPMINDIKARQYRDWRHLRHRKKDDSEILLRFSELAASISDTLLELRDTVAMDKRKKDDKIEQSAQAIAYQTAILNRKISYENIILYSVESWPKLPVSQDLTRRLLKELNKDRYIFVRDLDREVKYSADRVKEYAEQQPDKFKYSTDFISKSLAFVDSEFRDKHNFSPRTKAAAVRANITRY